MKTLLVAMALAWGFHVVVNSRLARHGPLSLAAAFDDADDKAQDDKELEKALQEILYQEDDQDLQVRIRITFPQSFSSDLLLRQNFPANLNVRAVSLRTSGYNGDRHLRSVGSASFGFCLMSQNFRKNFQVFFRVTD